MAAPVGSAQAIPFAYFPALPPPTQVTRELTLPQAARAGVVKLDAKGGGQGDAVSLELDGTKSVRGALTVTVRIEVTVPKNKTPTQRQEMRDFLPNMWKETETDMNHLHYKTRDGDPLRFVIEPRYREPEESAHSNFHQLKSSTRGRTWGTTPTPNSALESTATRSPTHPPPSPASSRSAT